MLGAQGATYDDLVRWGIHGLVSIERLRDSLIDSHSENEVVDETVSLPTFLSDLAIQSQSDFERWRSQRHLHHSDLDPLLKRHSRWFSFCHKHFSPKIASYFLEKKHEFDRVSYFIAEFSDESMAHEYYLRLNEHETTFDLLLLDSQSGLTAKHIGPILFSHIPSSISQLLRRGQNGQIWPPLSSSNGWSILQLTSSIPAVLDSDMRRRLLLELGEAHLVRQLDSSVVSESTAGAST